MSLGVRMDISMVATIMDSPLLRAKMVAGESGDGVLDHVRLNAALMGVDPDIVQEVSVAPLDSKHRRALRRVCALKACFTNAFHLLDHLPGSRYVLGYWHSIIPVEHAWVEHGGVYFDPTYDCLLESRGHDKGRHFALFSFSLEEVYGMTVASGGYPPDLYHVLWQRSEQ